MSFPAIARTMSRQEVDPRSVFCARCSHNAFVHSDLDIRRCLYSECPCEGWRTLAEPVDEPPAAEA